MRSKGATKRTGRLPGGKGEERVLFRKRDGSK